MIPMLARALMPSCSRQRVFQRFLSALLASALGLMMHTSVRAAVTCADGDALIRVPIGQSFIASRKLTDEHFTLTAWVWRAEDAGAPVNIAAFPDLLELTLDANGFPSVRFARESGDPLELRATAPMALPLNEWTLVSVIFDTSTGQLSIRAYAGEKTATDEVVSLGFTQPQRDVELLIGRNGDTPAMVGTYGLIAIRRQKILASDVDAIWSSRRYVGPYILDTRSTGGLLSGPDDALLMLNHSMSTFPKDGFVGADYSSQLAAVVGEAATKFNTQMFLGEGSIFPGFFCGRKADVRCVRIYVRGTE